MIDRPVEITIGQIHGSEEVPPIAIAVKRGRYTIMRVELSAQDFGLCVTGRVVSGKITRGNGR